MQGQGGMEMSWAWPAWLVVCREAQAALGSPACWQSEAWRWARCLHGPRGGPCLGAHRQGRGGAQRQLPACRQARPRPLTHGQGKDAAVVPLAAGLPAQWTLLQQAQQLPQHISRNQRLSHQHLPQGHGGAAGPQCSVSGASLATVPQPGQALEGQGCLATLALPTPSSLGAPRGSCPRRQDRTRMKGPCGASSEQSCWALCKKAGTLAQL